MNNYNYIDYDFEYTWGEIFYYGIATEEEMHLVCCINGRNIESLNDIIYVRTGYHDIEQYKESEGGDF